MEKKLESGSVLKITLAPLEESYDLWQALIAHGVETKMHGDDEMSINVIKDAICLVLSSKDVRAKMRPCMERATYNGNKCIPETFEDEKSREDYLEVCFEVAKANCLPFAKRLYAKYEPLLKKMREALK